MPPVKYPITIVADDGITELTGEAEFTDPAAQPQAPVVILGHGSPQGSAVPLFRGCLYVDVDNGGAYVATDEFDTDWVALGGDTFTTVPGVQSAGVAAHLMSPSGATVIVDGTGVKLLPGGGIGIGFYGSGPVPQPAAITAPAGGGTVDAEARAAIVAILAAIGGASGIGITA